MGRRRRRRRRRRRSRRRRRRRRRERRRRKRRRTAAIRTAIRRVTRKRTRRKRRRRRRRKRKRRTKRRRNRRRRQRTRKKTRTTAGDRPAESAEIAVPRGGATIVGVTHETVAVAGPEIEIAGRVSEIVIGTEKTTEEIEGKIGTVEAETEEARVATTVSEIVIGVGSDHRATTIIIRTGIEIATGAASAIADREIKTTGKIKTKSDGRGLQSRRQEVISERTPTQPERPPCEELTKARLATMKPMRRRNRR